MTYDYKDIDEQSEAIWKRFNDGKISHEEVQLELDKIWGKRDYGLISQLHEDINELVFDKLKWDRRTLDKINDKFDDISGNLDWMVYFDRHGIPKLTDEIKRNITLHLDRTELWVWWLLYLDHIESYILKETNGDVFNKHFEDVADYYDFLSTHISLCEMWDKVPKPFDNCPLDRYSTHKAETDRLRALEKAKEEEKRNRPPCPNCGADNLDGTMNIISKNRLRWLCNVCGRSYNKKVIK